MNLNKFSLLDRSLFWFNSKEYVFTSNGPSSFGLIFRDGDKYLVDGFRSDAVSFQFRAMDLRRLPCGLLTPSKDLVRIVEILKKELHKQGMKNLVID